MSNPTGRPVWKVARLGRVSSVSGEPLPADTEVVTALFPDRHVPGAAGGPADAAGVSPPGAASSPEVGDPSAEAPAPAPADALADAEAEGVRGIGLVRRDFFVHEATPERLAGAFGVWHTRTPPEKPDAARRLDLDLARQLLERLLEEADAEKAPVCLTLALLLARKRRLHLVEERADVLVARWPKEEATFEVPAPLVAGDDAERLQQDLMRLFDLGA